MTHGRRAPLLSAVSLLVFYATVAAAFTWPLVVHPAGRLAAPVGPGDPYLNLWILGWDLHALGTHPLSLLTGRVFDANIFFPAAGTLAYSDHLLLQALFVWPLYALSGNLTLCYNALLFGSLVASALAMYACARALTGSRAGALVAGLAWGFSPFHFAHLLHLQLQSLYFVPLAILFLHRLMAGRRRRDAVALGVMAGLQAISSVYWGVVTAMALAVAAIALAIAIGRWRSGVLLRRLVLAGAVGGLLVAPVAWQYWRVQQREGFSRNLYEASQHEAVAASYLRVPPGNVVFGRQGWLRPPPSAPVSRHEGPEQELFPGFVLVALAAVGAWRGWRTDAKPLVLSMTAIVLTGLVLSLGPDGVRSLYALLHRVVFGFQAIRAPARFGVLVVLGASVLAAAGVREIVRHRRTRRGSLVTGACLAALVGIEFFDAPIPTVPAPPPPSPAARWLAAAPDPGAVLYLPLDHDLGNTAAMIDSLAHHRRIVNGYSGQRPAFFMGLVDTLNQVPSPDALWTLHDLGVRFLVSPRPLLASPGALSPLVERAVLTGQHVYELVWSPEREAAVPRPEAPPPPEPGPVPFAAAERATYRVIWLTGASLGLAAGQAVIAAYRTSETVQGQAAADRAVESPSPAYRVSLEVETADWVERFYEARDRFETWMDASLLPIWQEQHLREGRREVDRTTRFDSGRRTVVIADGPALPLAIGARDALAAFLYARTLPLAPGYVARFPVMEGGRAITAEMRVTGIDTVEEGGRRVEAWRATATFASRSDRRPIAATLLITRDARRLPLRIDVDAGFGSFRVELVRYESE